MARRRCEKCADDFNPWCNDTCPSCELRALREKADRVLEAYRKASESQLIIIPTELIAALVALRPIT